MSLQIFILKTTFRECFFFFYPLHELLPYLKNNMATSFSLYPFFINNLSIDHFPPPLMIKNKLPRSIAQSVLLACIICQNPSLAKISDLVVAKATIIMIKVGILAKRENSPIKIKIPQRISKVPYHPDKIASKGLPEEFTRLAEEKFREIQQAYDAVKKERGIK